MGGVIAQLKALGPLRLALAGGVGLSVLGDALSSAPGSSSSTR